MATAKLPCRILIVDDDLAVRAAMRLILDWHSFQICGEAKDGEEAIQRVIELRPDIVLLDVNLPGMNGVDTAYEIRRILPTTKIVFLALHDSPAILSRARLLGHAFVFKSQVGTELIPALMCLANQSNRAVKKPKSYRIRLMCEHADYDKWIVKECDGLSLQEVANRLWEFNCPIHGPQSRLPFEVELKKDVADFQEGCSSSFFF